MEQRESFDNRLSGSGDKQPDRVVNEPRAPEGTLLRQVQDTKESLSVLKSQVSFANQCFNLLQNQMKHAADTLNILQDQINVAQRTVNSLTEGGDSQQHIITHHQSAAALTGIGSYQVPSSRVPCVAGPMEEQRVIVHDSEGPKIYTLSKSSISLGNQNVLAAEGGIVKEHCPGMCVAQPIPVHCHCSACLSHASLQHLPSQFQTQNQGHARTSVHQVNPEVLLSQSTCTSPGKLGRDGVSAVESNIPGPPDHVPASPECSKESSDSRKTAVKSESASSSPMAHQLLQVIDVLQTADDDDGAGNKSALISSSSSLSSHIPGGYGIKGDPQAYETGMSVQHRPSRRNRKQNISPLKPSAQSSVQQDIRSPVKSSVSRESLDLMRVPAPVLASTLEPEFLVVPSSSFSYDSPPGSATGEDAVGKNVKLSPDSRSVATVVSSTAAASEVTAGSTVVLSQNSSSCATRSLSTQPKCADVQDVCRVARDSAKEYDLEGSRGGNCSFNSRVKTHPPGSFGSGIDEGSPSLSPGPKRRLTGTSPLNSEVRMPFMLCTSAERGVESGLTSANSGAEPTQSCSAVASNTEHPSSVAVSSGNHVSSQAHQMAVISLPNSTESSVGNSQRTSTPPTKKPIILSRRTSRGEQNIPQGLVVLVPTIEDAKRLIATSGTNAQARTPVLVPQHMLNEIHSKNTDADEKLEQQLIRKRNYDLVSPPRTLSSKRPAVDSVVID